MVNVSDRSLISIDINATASGDSTWSVFLLCFLITSFLPWATDRPRERRLSTHALSAR